MASNSNTSNVEPHQAHDDAVMLCHTLEEVYEAQVKRNIYLSKATGDISEDSSSELLHKLKQNEDKNRVRQRIGMVKRWLDLVCCLEGKPGSSNIVPGGTRVRKPNRNDLPESVGGALKPFSNVRATCNDSVNVSLELDWFDYNLSLLTVSGFNRYNGLCQKNGRGSLHVTRNHKLALWCRSILSRNRRGNPLWCGDIALDGPILTVLRDSIVNQQQTQFNPYGRHGSDMSEATLSDLAAALTNRFRRRIHGNINLLTLLAFVEAYPPFQVLSNHTDTEIPVAKILQGYCECQQAHVPEENSYHRRYELFICHKTLSNLRVRFRSWIRKTKLFKSQLSFVATDMPGEGFPSTAWTEHALDFEDHITCFSGDYARISQDSNELCKFRSRYRRPFANNYAELLLPREISKLSYHMNTPSSSAIMEPSCNWRLKRLQSSLCSFVHYSVLYAGHVVPIVLHNVEFKVGCIKLRKDFLEEQFHKCFGVEIPLQTFPFSDLQMLIDHMFGHRWVAYSEAGHCVLNVGSRSEDGDLFMCSYCAATGTQPDKSTATTCLQRYQSIIKSVPIFPVQQSEEEDDTDWKVYLLLVYCAVVKLSAQMDELGVSSSIGVRELRNYLNERGIKLPSKMPGNAKGTVRSFSFTSILECLPFISVKQENKKHTLRLQQMPIDLGHELDMMLEISRDNMWMRRAVYFDLHPSNKDIVEGWYHVVSKTLAGSEGPPRDSESVQALRKDALQRSKDLKANGGSPIRIEDIGTSSAVIVTLVGALQNQRSGPVRDWIDLEVLGEKLRKDCLVIFPRERRLKKFIECYCNRRLELHETADKIFVRTRQSSLSSEAASFFPGEPSYGASTKRENNSIDMFRRLVEKLSAFTGSNITIPVEALCAPALLGEVDIHAWTKVFEWVVEQSWCHLYYPTKSFASAFISLTTDESAGTITTGTSQFDMGNKEQSREKCEMIHASGLPSRYYIYGEGVGMDEDLQHEFKGGFTGGVHKAILNIAPRYIVAFLNASGGTLYFGITNDGVVHGVKLSRADKDSINLAKDSIAQRIGPPGVLYLIFHPVFVPIFRRVYLENGRTSSNFQCLPNTYVIELSVGASPNPSVLHYEILCNFTKRGNDMKDSSFVYWVRQAASVRAMKDPQEIAEWAFGRGRMYGGTISRQSLHISKLDRSPSHTVRTNNSKEPTPQLPDSNTTDSCPTSPEENNPQYREVDIALAPEHGVAWQVPSEKRFKDSFGSNTVLTLRLSQTPLKNGVGLVVESLGGILCKTQIVSRGALLLEVNGQSVEKLRLNKIRKILTAGKIRRLRFLSPLPRET